MDIIFGAFYKSGDIDKAVTYFEKALSLNPNYLPAWNNLGTPLKGVGKKKRNCKVFQKALENSSSQRQN